MRVKKKHIGIITFGKSRPAKKMIEVDATFDDVTAKMLFEAGIKALKGDKEAVISYAIEKAITAYAIKKTSRS